MESISELFEKVLYKTTDDMYVQCPAKVEAVNGNYVDVKLYVNDEYPDIVIYHVPIQRPETQRTYIFLGIKAGDRGVCRFFDRSVEGYLQSNFDYNSDDRQHNINDRCFELGFLPDKEAFVYPEADIEIGLKDGSAKINITDGNISIIGGNINITGSSVNLGSNTTIDGKVFLEHTHSNGHEGSPTGAVL